MDPAGSETGHVNTISTREPGRISPPDHLPVSEGPHREDEESIAGDVRRGEVGLAHSSGEAGEHPEKEQESVERRQGHGERGTTTCAGHRAGESMSQRLSRVQGFWKQRKRKNGLALFHLLTVEALEAAFLLSRKAAAGVGWHQVDGHAGNMKNNITDLHRRGYIRAA